MKAWTALALSVVWTACADNHGAPTTTGLSNISFVSSPSNASNPSNGDDEDDTASPDTSTSAPTEASATTPEETSEPPTNSEASDPDTTAPDTTAGNNSPPVFLSLNASANEITEGEAITFTAILTDPDGVDDILGGSLLKSDESLDLGPFLNAGQPGTYSIELTWAQLDQAETIEFEGPSTSRMFKVRFFDKGANEIAMMIGVGLTCPLGGACGGSCKDFQNDADHCGSCALACTENDCDNAVCDPTFGECFSMADGHDTCQEACQAAGETCVAAACGIDNDYTWVTDQGDGTCDDGQYSGVSMGDCDDPINWDFVGPGGELKCCCTQSK